MSYTLEAVNNCTKKLNFNFESVDLTSQIDSALKEKQKTANLKGFRKGKAPLGMIKQLYGGQVENEALYRFIQEKFVEAIQKESLKTVGYPKFENTNYEAEKKNVSFDVTVEIFPEFELKDFTTLKFKKDNTDIDEKELENLKKNYLNSKSEMVEVEDNGVALENGHFAVINFEGEKEDGEKPDNMKGQEYLLELGSNTFIPGFEDALLGSKIGEKKVIDLTFPEDYHAEDLKGAKVKFDVEVLEIKEKRLPELTDDLAKELGFDSVDDFQSKIRKNLEYQKERQAKEKLHQEILDKLIEENEFEVPGAMVQQQEQHLRQDLTNTLKHQGFTDQMAEDYFDKWQDDMTKKAVFQVKSGLILNKLAEEFNVDTSEDDLKKKFEEMAEYSGMTADQVEQQYSGNESLKSNLMYAIREEKTFEKVLEKVSLD